MKRIIAVLSVMAIMAAMMVVLAMPAFAANSDNANCVGQAFSTAEPRTKGAIVSQVAQTGQLGELISGAATGERDVICRL